MNALIIIGLLFAGVAIIVFFTERYGKPLTAEEQSKYWKIAITLVFILIVARIIHYMVV